MKLILFLLALCATLAQAQPTLANSDDIAAAKARANHTGTQAIATVTSLQTALDSKPTLGQSSRLAKFRERLDTLTTAPVVAFMGDSMLEAYSTNIKLRDAFHTEFGMGGYAFLDANSGGGAASPSLDFTDWFKGRYIRLSGSGHTAAINVDNLLPVEANTLKIYYVRKPGGGVFKVQSRKNGGAWTDEAAHLTVSSDGALAGQIISITKTDMRAVWEVRAVWVSGSVDIIGGALYDTASTGARLAMLAAGSTDMVNWISAPSAVSQPIIANIAPHLIILSHLDGASAVNSYQATWQDSVNTWAATSPTWLIVGPPVGSSDATDAINLAHIAAQKNLADSRNDAFWDNRFWTNSNPAQAISRGFLYSDADPHYTALAQRNWIPLMLSQTGLSQSAYRGTASGKAAIKVLGGAEIRRSRRLSAPADDFAVEINGDLDLGPKTGSTTSGRLLLWDMDGPVNGNDNGQLLYQGNALKFGLSAVTRLVVDQPIGQLQIYDAVSTAAAPNGNLGLVSVPFRTINLGKTINANTVVGDQTISKACGRVWFDVGDASNTYTNTLVTVDSIVMATVIGNDATATSVRVQTISSGFFVLTLNAAATAKTAVNFWIMP